MKFLEQMTQDALQIQKALKVLKQDLQFHHWMYRRDGLLCPVEGGSPRRRLMKEKGLNNYNRNEGFSKTQWTTS